MRLLKHIFFILVLIIFFSCEERVKSDYLKSGLEGYLKKRIIKEDFVDGFTLEEVAFFKKADDNYEMVLRLNNNLLENSIKKYSFGIHAYESDKVNNNKGEAFKVWDIKPKIEIYEGHKYLIKDLKRPKQKIDSIVFFLYDREKYNGVIGNRIIVRNIKI